MRFWTILAALFAVTVQFAVRAEARDQFNQKEAVVIDPQKSYIFYRTNDRFEIQFLREVTPGEQAEWVVARTAALERAQARYERTASEYRRAVETCRNRPSPCLTMDRPIPVTNENFAFAPAEADNFARVARGPQFTKASDTEYTYLVAVPPGTYSLYGQIAIAGNGIAGTCLCMGSIRFEARAGQIMDLGEVHFPATDILRGRRPAVPGVRPSVLEIVPYAAGMARPDRLNGLPIVAAELRAAPKMPNFFGILIDRHPAMPGVLRYERDRVIDERTGDDPVTLIEAAGGGTGG